MTFSTAAGSLKRLRIESRTISGSPPRAARSNELSAWKWKMSELD